MAVYVPGNFCLLLLNLYLANGRQNKHQLGDQWNGEDLSIFSLDDLPLPLSPTMPMPSNESTASLIPHAGPNIRENLDKSAVTPENLKAKLRTPSIMSRMTDAPELTNAPGYRAAEAYVRPSPLAVAGTILSYGFDLRNCTFTLKLLVHESGPDAQTTDIALPEFHFPKDGCEVEVTSGKWMIGADDTGGGLIQRLRWWHLEGEQIIKITGVRKRQAMMLGLDEDESYLEQCQENKCSIM